jgi:hypothetical protein
MKTEATNGYLKSLSVEEFKAHTKEILVALGPTPSCAFLNMQNLENKNFNAYMTLADLDCGLSETPEEKNRSMGCAAIRQAIACGVEMIDSVTDKKLDPGSF